MSEAITHWLKVAGKLAGLISIETFIDLSRLSREEWQEIVSMAQRHCLGPQLHLRLRESNSLSVLPPELSERLEKTYIIGVAHGTRRSVELSAVLSHFNLGGIPVIVLKGPHLAELVYRNWALRPMADFDLLVKTNDLARAAKVLQELGYRSPVEVACDASARRHFHLAQMTNDRGSLVELHWTLEPPESPIKPDIDGLWSRAEPAVIAGVETRIMSKEDLLLYLCVHTAYQHRFSSGLLALQDISLAISSMGDRLDWDKLAGLSKQWGAERCLALVLYLTKELFRADSPVFKKTTILNPADELQVLEIAIMQLMGPEEKTAPVSSWLARFFEAGGGLKKMNILFSRIFPPADIVAMTYSVDPASKKLYLCYFKRFAYLIRCYGRTVFQLALKDQQALSEIRRQEQKDMLVRWLTSGQTESPAGL